MLLSFVLFDPKTTVRKILIHYSVAIGTVTCAFLMCKHYDPEEISPSDSAHASPPAEWG